MNDLETCREQILSEDTRDFISNPLRTPLFNELLEKRSMYPGCRAWISMHLLFQRTCRANLSGAFFLQFHSELFCSCRYGNIEPDRHPSCAELSGTSIKKEKAF